MVSMGWQGMRAKELAEAEAASVGRIEGDAAAVSVAAAICGPPHKQAVTLPWRPEASAAAGPDVPDVLRLLRA